MTATPASAPGSRIFSLHVGLNDVSPRDYPDPGKLRLSGSLKDVDQMVSIAKKIQSVYPTVLENEQATVADVKATFMDIAAVARAGDLVFFTYSGHGAWIRDTTETENKRYTEQQSGYAHLWFHPTILLYDRMMMDDEWRVIWRAFPPFVRVFTVFDSCVSGTVDIANMQPVTVSDTGAGFQEVLQNLWNQIQGREAAIAGSGPLQVLADFFKGETPALQGPNEGADLSPRTPGTDLIRKIVERKEDLYAAIQTKFAPAEPYWVMGLHLSACTDAQVAMEDRDGGVFTQAFEKVLHNWTADDGLTYDGLLDAVKAQLRGGNQTPELIPFGIVPEGITKERVFGAGRHPVTLGVLPQAGDPVFAQPAGAPSSAVPA